jgi:Lysozyme inhibitor LprI
VNKFVFKSGLTLYGVTVCIVAILLSGFVQDALAVQGDTRGLELEAANHQLNNAYRRIMSMISPTDQKALKEAQRQWIKFRDQDCKWAFKAEPMECLMGRTESRVKELQESLIERTDGKYTTVGEKP